MDKWNSLGLGSFPGFDVATGTGGLDVILYTGAGGASNVGVGSLHNFTFEDPADAPGGGVTTFSGTWGAGTAAIHGPVTVDNLLNYLHAQFGPSRNIPVFTFDLNQTGSNPDLLMGVEVTVVNPSTSAVINSWSFDTVNNGVFDSSSLRTMPGEICIDGITQDFCVDNNKGSGKMDFLLYAPTMDLSLYSGLGYEFHTFLKLGDLDDGFEELFISGSVTTAGSTPPPAIPEPSTSAFLGIGLLGFAAKFARRRLQR